MNQPTTEAPKKLFREEAKTGSISCLACGGPITLKGFGNVERVSCPYCGSTLEPQDSGELTLLQQAERQRMQSALPLHARGKLDDTQWEIIGIMWREALVDGVAYPWQEFLLFNPYAGFRWLVYSMSDGQWSFGGALDGAPQLSSDGTGHRIAKFKGRAFKHFGASPARVTYCEGEFTWQVQVGDQAQTEEYIDPPQVLSIERSHSEGGAELNFTQLRYLPPHEVWSAFSQTGSPPPETGVGNLKPNPHRQSRGFYLASLGLMLVLWVVATVVYVGGRDTEVVVDEAGLPIAAPFMKEVEIGDEGSSGTLDFSFGVSPLSNGWVYADVLLVNQATEEAINFGAEVDNWNGVADGESYNEGTNPRRVKVPNVPGGKYLLQVTPQVDPQTPTKPTVMNVRLREDIVLGRYIALPLLFILLFPIINGLRSLVFESRRWHNSDYGTSLGDFDFDLE